jgi:glycosyltransferase involved in cell wall biosynthesis
VDTFAHEFRRRNHRVLIVAPEFADAPADETDVIRVPAIQNFNGSDFSVRLPIPGYLATAVQDFRPDLVHSHHPFLLGDTALRVAASHNVPLVFQHHTMYERYTHHVPGDSPAMERFVVDLSTQYANLCDQVLAPSESVADVLRDRGVVAPVEVLPTGVDTQRFANGDGGPTGKDLDIPAEAFLVGHVGRLAPEKNLVFLAESVARFIQQEDAAHFLVVGEGPSEREIRRIFADRHLEHRLHLPGILTGRELVDAYHAMDVFAFASQSETQGMVLAEAMAARCPVVGLDAPGVREVIVDGRNGRLLPYADTARFAEALRWVLQRSTQEYQALSSHAREMSETYSISACTERALRIYRALLKSFRGSTLEKNDWESRWQSALRRIDTEWELLTARARAVQAAVFGGPPSGSV